MGKHSKFATQQLKGIYKMVIVRGKGKKPPRKHTVKIQLNDKEKQVLDKFCKKYKITNRSKLLRELIFSTVLSKFEDDYPSLFDGI